MFVAQTQIRVRYAETDQMGYVYYGNYSTYYEVARVEAFRALGLSYKELEQQGVLMPILENHSKYLAPALYDDLLTIKVSIPSRPNIRIQFHYEIFNQSNKLIHTGETHLVFVSQETRKPCKIPYEMERLLNPYFDEK